MLISVVIPAYNQSAYLRLALDGVLAQTHHELEIIVVDDGSTDDTPAVCQAITDPRLRYIRQDNDRSFGLGARNRGMLEARGEWIALLDQDDLWAPQKLAAQLRLAQENPALGCVFCPARLIDDDGIVTGYQSDDLPEGEVYAHLLKRNRYYVSSGMFRRRLLFMAGIPHESCGYADWQLWMSLARHAPVGVVHEYLCDYRIHAGSFLQQHLSANRLKVAADNRITLLQQRHRIPATRPECLAEWRRGMKIVSGYFFDAAEEAAAEGQWRVCLSGLRQAFGCAPWHSLKPRVLLKRSWRLLGVVLRLRKPTSG